MTPFDKSDKGLSAAVFQILLALADDDRHGYAIAQEIESRTNGRVRLGPATLYSNLKRLEADGLIAECRRRPPRDRDDPRRRYYRLAPRGRKVVAAEVDRLHVLMCEARSLGFEPQRVKGT